MRQKKAGGGEVIDLMEALQRSVERSRGGAAAGAEKKAPAKRSAAAKEPAKKTPAKKAKKPA